MVNKYVKVSRYNSHPSGIEAKEIIRDWPFQLANIYKYIIRRKSKDSYVGNLKKAITYIHWERELPSMRVESKGSLPYLEYKVLRCEKSDLVETALTAYFDYAHNHDKGSLLDVENAVNELIKGYEDHGREE